MPVWDEDNLSAPHTQREMGDVMDDRDAKLARIRDEIVRFEYDIALRRAERLHREARALWWQTLLLAGVTLAVAVGAAVWGAQ